MPASFQLAEMSFQDAQNSGAHHIFRPTWAIRRLIAGIPIKFVRLVGGWENIATLEIYVRIMDTDDAIDANWT